jgi:hypothetical protein
MVASARSYGTRRADKKDEEGKARGGEQWQRDCWDYYDLIAEYAQACNIQGALLSRAKLVVMELGEDGVWAPSTNPFALAARDELYGGEDGQAEMFRLFGINFSVTGGAWLIGPIGAPDPDADNGGWRVIAETEIQKNAFGQWKVNGKPLEGDWLKIHIWRPHPKNPKKSTSPSRATLPVLSQIVQLRKRTSAQIDSRLTGGGVWLLPAETEFPAQPGRQVNPGDPPTTRDSVIAGDANGMMDLVADAAEEAIEDQQSASARLPIIATVPGEYMQHVKEPINFWSDLDKTAPALRKEQLEAMANGMDVPQEVLLGGSGSNHWNMWLADENTIKIHGEPTLQIIVSGITQKFLRPGLKGLVPDPTRFKFVADTSQMRLRPNRSKEAIELNRDLILKDATVLRENGFTEEDLMTDEEMKRAIIRRASLGQTTPELVAWAWSNLGIDVPAELMDQRDAVEARPAPSLEEHPVRDLPERPESHTASANPLVWAAEQIVDRALQRAGNRIKTKFGIKDAPTGANRLYQHVELSIGDLDDLLKDAWDGCHLDDYGVDPAELQRALDIYTRALVMSRRTPDRATLGRALQLLMRQNAA